MNLLDRMEKTKHTMNGIEYYAVEPNQVWQHGNTQRTEACRVEGCHNLPRGWYADNLEFETWNTYVYSEYIEDDEGELLGENHYPAVQVDEKCYDSWIMFGTEVFKDPVDAADHADYMAKVMTEECRIYDEFRSKGGRARDDLRYSADKIKKAIEWKRAADSLATMLKIQRNRPGLPDLELPAYDTAEKLLRERSLELWKSGKYDRKEAFEFIEEHKPTPETCNSWWLERASQAWKEGYDN